MSDLLPAQRTPFTRNEDIKIQWYLIDAEGQTLGRLASRIAHILRGKHRTDYAPHQDNGDGIVVINASKMVVTGKKLDQKIYYKHSRYPGGLKTATLRQKMEKEPDFPIETAVKRMLPAGPMGRRLLTRLRVFGGEKHDLVAQKPERIEVAYR